MPIDFNGIDFPLQGNLRQDYFHSINEPCSLRLENQSEISLTPALFETPVCTNC